MLFHFTTGGNHGTNQHTMVHDNVMDHKKAEQGTSRAQQTNR
jgi:hypothetical protein